MKILLADDHALFREGLRYVLTGLAEDVEVFEVKDGSEALAFIAAGRELDLVLLDLAMPGMDGFAGLRAVRARLPSVPVVILAASENSADIRAALNGGAMGFIPKSSTASVMLSALRLVLSGSVYLPPVFLQRSSARGASGQAPSTLEALHLTARQQDVLRLLSRGQSNKEIARTLGLVEGTVKLHISAILKAFGVDNRTQAVVAAAQLLREAGEAEGENLRR